MFLRSDLGVVRERLFAGKRGEIHLMITMIFMTNDEDWFTHAK